MEQAAITYEAITLEKTLSIWWSFMWRTMLVGILVGFVLGFIGGFIVFAAGKPDLARAIGAILGWLGSIPVSIWALKTALSKKHDGFSLVLVKSS